MNHVEVRVGIEPFAVLVLLVTFLAKHKTDGNSAVLNADEHTVCGNILGNNLLVGIELVPLVDAVLLHSDNSLGIYGEDIV
ncbi:MAG: hypothetical protein IJT89_03205 [Bacteroidaceae bacterium]|nr:hypothetical protein [Bacteroidaceae bacterium]